MRARLGGVAAAEEPYGLSPFGAPPWPQQSLGFAEATMFLGSATGAINQDKEVILYSPKTLFLITLKLREQVLEALCLN